MFFKVKMHAKFLLENLKGETVWET